MEVPNPAGPIFLFDCQGKGGNGIVDGLGQFFVTGMDEWKMFLQIFFSFFINQKLGPDSAVKDIKCRFFST